MFFASIKGPSESLDELADEIGSLYKIPRGSSIYLIDPFTITSFASFPDEFIVFRK